jgi:hypothetical protein
VTHTDTRTWLPIDAPPPTDTTAVETATTHANDLARILDHDGARLATALRNARLWQATGVRATSNTTTGPALWCDTHDRTLTRCLEEDLTCTGHYQTRSDPAGETAIELGADQARADHAELIRLLRQLPRLVALVDRYETRPGSGASLPDIDWCRSCYRNDRHHQPIERDREGHPYFAGLCRWCGAFKAEHQIEPPLELLRARHLGQRITTRMVATALAKQPPRTTKKRR